MIRTLLIAATLFIAACAAPITSYTLPADDRAAIATRITNFERAFLNGNTREVINVVPPRLIQAIASDAGVSEAQLRTAMTSATRSAMAEIKVVSFGMSLEQAKFMTTPSGRPYGLIPTQTVVQAPNGIKLQSNNNTLTLEDGGKWHLIRIDDARQINLMRKVYPDFKGVTFPKGTSKVTG